MGVEMRWDFHNPVKIFLGRGCRQRILGQLQNKVVLVVTTKRGRQQLNQDKWLGELSKNDRNIWVDTVQENPDIMDLQQKIDLYKHEAIDAILAFGGGSAMDAAKALRLGVAWKGKRCLAELLHQPELHAEVSQAPLYALPTTAGTGSEVTPFATVWNHDNKQKLSLASDLVFPTAAYIDSELTDTVPVSVTLSTGLDAINQAAESVWNKNANPITLACATRALKLALPALPLLIEGKGSEQERDALAEASLLAGLAISHTRTALCHSISYPLTAHFNVPHGLACAFTMPTVCALNIAADDGRFKQLALELFGESDAQLFGSQLTQLNQRLKVNEAVKGFIPDLDSLLALQAEMFTPERAGNSFAGLNEQSLPKILRNAWDNTL